MIVITAPTGNIGRHLLPLLLESAPAHAEELRVVVRDPARLPDAVRERVEVITGSHGDAEVVDRAFEGADAVFWLVPPDASLPPHDAYCGFTGPATKALVAHGVGHVVGVSALGRGTPAATARDSSPRPSPWTTSSPAPASRTGPWRTPPSSRTSWRGPNRSGRRASSPTSSTPDAGPPRRRRRHRGRRRRAVARPLVDRQRQRPGPGAAGSVPRRPGPHHERAARPSRPLRTASRSASCTPPSSATASTRRSSRASST